MAVILPQSMQSDLQSSLPIVPNNGNPAGAHNMPQAEQTGGAASAAPSDPYEWLKPSRYMDEVNALLGQQDAMLEQSLFELKNPQANQMYNLQVNDGQFDVVPLNDYGMTIGATAYDDVPLTYPLPNEAITVPQYLPILPGD